MIPLHSADSFSLVGGDTDLHPPQQVDDDMCWAQEGDVGGLWIDNPITCFLLECLGFPSIASKTLFLLADLVLAFSLHKGVMRL